MRVSSLALLSVVGVVACGDQAATPAATAAATTGASSSTAGGAGSGGAGGGAGSGGAGGEHELATIVCEDPESRLPASVQKQCLGELTWVSSDTETSPIYGIFERDLAIEAALVASDPNVAPPTTTEIVFSTVQMLDLNGDGRLDLLYNRPSKPWGASQVLQNPDGTFAEGPPIPAANCNLMADLDGNGYPDLVCFGLNQGLHEEVVWNDGAGPLWGSPTLLPNIFPEAALAWDVDEDGWLDIVLSVYNGPNHVFRNKGNRKFEDVAGGFGLNDPGLTWATAFVDFDGDGRADPYVMNDGNAADHANTALRALGPNADGEPGFEPFAPMSPACDDQGFFGVGTATPMALSLGDIDSNGTFEAYLALVQNSPLLSLQADGNWLDFRPYLNMEEPRTTTNGEVVHWDSMFWDVDHDGTLDFLLTAGDDVGHAFMPNRGLSAAAFYHGLPCNGFETATQRVGLDAGGQFATLCTEDLDGDLDLDLVVGSLNAPPLVYRNKIEAAGKHLLVELRGTTSNPGAVGAVVRVKAGKLERAYPYIDHVAPEHSAPGLLDIGLGAASKIDEMRIRWPSGYEQLVKDLPAGTRQVVVEPSLIEVEPKSRHLAAGSGGTVTITVKPRDESGQLMMAGAVSIDSPFQAVEWIAPAETAADGTVTRSFKAAEAKGSAVVEVKIDGKALVVRPRVYFD